MRRVAVGMVLLSAIACRVDRVPAAPPSASPTAATSAPLASPAAASPTVTASPPAAASPAARASASPRSSPSAAATPNSLCGLSPSDWCPAPAGDPCGAHKDTASCRADSRCVGMRYRGESFVPCEYDARGFAANCPTVGCVSISR